MGGAAGHMKHPFDLGDVRTGNDLLDFFNKAREHLEAEGAGAVKIDGVNVSFKLVEIGGVRQFAVDRGSMKEIDISGITMSRVDERFPEGHGMRPAIKTLLTILNKALPAIKPQLQELGMCDNPSLFLNTEYVEGTTNVTDYDENFLAIHGLNQFYEKTAKSGPSKGNVRPGAERPTMKVIKKGVEVEVPIKDPSREVPYDPQIMETLIDKIKPIAEELGFKVYGSVPTNRTEDVDINFDKTLSEPLTIQISDDREVTKPLRDWLSAAENPDYDSLKVNVITVDPETNQEIVKPVVRHPLHKELYKAIAVDKEPVVKLVDQADAERAINGALFMHATRMLGNDVLRGLTSPMGDLMNHEGVVLRDEEKFGPNPVKITGEFILGNLGGGFGGSVTENEEDFIGYEFKPVNEEDEDEDPVVDADYSKTVAVVPGAFKPPHNGHLAMVRQYANLADEVIVLISRPTKSGRRLPNGREITAEDSQAIWKLLVKDLPNVEVSISSHASPLTAAYEFVGRDGPLQPGTKVILDASTKGNDVKRWTGAEKYIKDGVELIDPRSSAVEPTARPDGQPFSATDFRNALGDVQDNLSTINDFIGEENVADLLSILGLTGPVSEMTGVASVAGAPTADGGPWKNKKEIRRGNEEEKEESTLKTENNDLVTVDEVMRLIMERGILR